MTRARYMPPEWAPHAATWMGFPRDSYAASGLTREATRGAWSAVANVISEYEPVKMLCHAKDLAVAKRRLSESIDLIPVTLNDAWLRDIGPTFVLEDEALIAIDWQFNGWGQNTEFEWEDDDAIARQIAEILAVSMVEYLDYQGKKKILKANGLLATCIQHEIDHLNGILFIDYLSKLKRDIILKKLSKQKLEKKRLVI